MEIQSIDSFLEYVDKVRQRTVRVVRCIPTDKVEWSYREGKFTLGDLVRHIATTERHMWAENVQGQPSRYAGCGKELAEEPYSPQRHRVTEKQDAVRERSLRT